MFEFYYCDRLTTTKLITISKCHFTQLNSNDFNFIYIENSISPTEISSTLLLFVIILIKNRKCPNSKCSMCVLICIQFSNIARIFGHRMCVTRWQPFNSYCHILFCSSQKRLCASIDVSVRIRMVGQNKVELILYVLDFHVPINKVARKW